MFTASPATGYEVDKWSVDSVEVQTGGNDLHVKQYHGDPYRCRQLQDYDIHSYRFSAGANGSVAPLSAVVDYDGSQLFTASPATGYEVDKWSVDSVEVQTGGTTYTLSNITATHTVAVSFKITTFTVTASAGPTVQLLR